MKSKLLILLSFAVLTMNAQTTHDLDWFAGMGTDIDLLIETGDTVRWTWTSINHTVQNVPGNSVETFNSGVMVPVGSTFSWTFTVVGDNDYFCGVHGAGSMAGTITVEDNLGIDDETLYSFRIAFNSTSDIIGLKLPQNLSNGLMIIHDMLGKKALEINFKDKNEMNVDVSALNDGIYLISINSDNFRHTKRFLKF